MLALNAEREYAKAKEIERLLLAISGEAKIPSIGYYDLHWVAKKRGVKILPMGSAIGALQRAGFASSRTHFCPTAIRTGAPHKEAIALLSQR
jgi:tRNA (guanine26-N2/guanine27-N2)-dimethyltransferase